jgi:hypothetical protein
MKEEKFPARLHVLIARSSEIAIVIRRGPSRFTGIFAWDRKQNTFEMSQWLKGRIYERRSDISSSGKYWIYFAMNGKWNSDTKGAWTTVSKVPWLKAVSLFAKGDCWNGGGLFLDDETYWLNGQLGHEQLFNSTEVKRNKDYDPADQYGGECLNVYYNRLQRDGWVLKNKIEKEKWSSVSVFEKLLSKNWVLRKICHEQLDSPKGKGCYWDEHEIQNNTGEFLSCPDWEWAEWVDDCIVYAKNGCLFRIGIDHLMRLDEPILLHDFNDYKFEARQAPY